jgi:hypothetical protein
MIVLLPLAAAGHAQPLRAGADADALPPGALYRFRAADGNLMISSVLPEQAIQSGYEVIDNRGRVLRVVDAAIPEEQRLKMQQEMRIRQQDAQLRRLYPTPQDAERARDRQISSLRLGIDYARGITTSLTASWRKRSPRRPRLSGPASRYRKLFRGTLICTPGKFVSRKKKSPGLSRTLSRLARTLPRSSVASRQ